MRIELSHPVTRTGRVMQVEGMFDVPQAERQAYSIDVPAEFENVAAMSGGWDIGLIVGPSGAGKTTVLQRFFGEWMSHPYDMWPEDKAIIDVIGSDVRSAAGLLTAVGLGSPPAWLRPFQTLSNGEQFRAGIARELARGEPIALDEFTSVVDRTVAQVASHATQKAVRRQGLKLVLLYLPLRCRPVARARLGLPPRHGQLRDVPEGVASTTTTTARGRRGSTFSLAAV